MKSNYLEINGSVYSLVLREDSDYYREYEGTNNQENTIYDSEVLQASLSAVFKQASLLS